MIYLRQAVRLAGRQAGPQYLLLLPVANISSLAHAFIQLDAVKLGKRRSVGGGRGEGGDKKANQNNGNLFFATDISMKYLGRSIEEEVFSEEQQQQQSWEKDATLRAVFAKIKDKVSTNVIISTK